jgi:hypothetical protein
VEVDGQDAHGRHEEHARPVVGDERDFGLVEKGTSLESDISFKGRTLDHAPVIAVILLWNRRSRVRIPARVQGF